MSDALLHLSTYPSGLFSAKTHSQYTCKALLPVVISFIIYFFIRYPFQVPTSLKKYYRIKASFTPTAYVVTMLSLWALFSQNTLPTQEYAKGQPEYLVFDLMFD
jgi:phenylalanine-4-hydroxylase